MRLWSLHPQYLDSRGLCALWREGLLAMKVLKGETRGYTRHPQLIRFSAVPDPVGTVSCYLSHVYREAAARGYHFNIEKLGAHSDCMIIPVTEGQLIYEFGHLMQKLRVRDPEKLRELSLLAIPLSNPQFHVVQGTMEPWEKIS